MEQSAIIDDIKMYFVLGRSRSGTTLIRTILDRHPNTVFPIESNVISKLLAKYNTVSIWNKENIIKFYNDLLKLGGRMGANFIDEWKINQTELKQKLLEHENCNSIAVLIKVVYLQFKSIYFKESIQIIIEKNPLNIKQIDLLFKTFPEAKFICMVRNPLDNIVSCKKAFWNLPNAYLANVWKEYYSTVFNKFINHHEKLLFVRYEDFIFEPENNFKIICDFFNLTYMPNLLKADDRVYKYYENFDKAFNKIHKNVIYEINSSSVGRHKKELSCFQIKLCSLVTADIANKFSYNIKEYKNNLPLFFLSRFIIYLTKFSFIIKMFLKK